uniref:TNFR-Cys domain-containing protein n=1 Tax=Amazona collaria TaxID=241587 RepID=A0A8B9GC96_9PSIT
CSHSVDTKCSPCRPNTYTAIWNLSPQCFACSPPCRKGFVQNQACTTSQDRICSCPPNEYCILKTYEYCRICKAHKKCGKGYRVSRRGTNSTDTECKPCPPGTFSHEESYDTSCVPHTVCRSVAVPGNSINDTVCRDLRTAVATVLPNAVLNLLLTQTSASKRPEIITRPVTLNSASDNSHIIGELFTHLKSLCSSKHKEQHLLQTSGSSSSSLNNPTESARVSVISNKNSEKKKTEGFQQQHSWAEGCKRHSRDSHNSVSSGHSGNGGMQVDVTCIVKVCSPDCSSQFPEHTSSTGMDYGNTPYYSPTGEEIPLSGEEHLFKKGAHCQKFPVGIEDAGMKTS